MKHLNEFTISLSGTKKETSEYSFKLNKVFFEHFEDIEILDSDVKVTMNLTKSSNAFEMKFTLSGDLTITCDRCLEPLVQPINYKTELIIKYGNKFEEIDDKVITIGYEDDEINIAPYIYEYAKLALPIQRIHPEGECNEEMLEQMEKYERHEGSQTTDSRWNALAELKDKLS